MNSLSIESIQKSFGSVRALADISIEIPQGECLALLGPSGCGKTTLLRIISGLEQPDRGRIRLAGRDITYLPPEERKIGFVFQNYALFPHLDVFENVAFGLRARRAANSSITNKVKQSLELVSLSGYEKRRVYELSGGQQQRVAIARALAIEPVLLLLDEPLSNLDVSLREQTGRQLRELIERLRITTIFVTHDQSEAFALSDRIALIRDGQLQQLGTPAELYFRPVNTFAASFIGRSNFFNARLAERKRGYQEYIIEERFTLLGPILTRGEYSRATVRIRPESIAIHPENADPEMTIPARIVGMRLAGANVYYVLEIGGLRLDAATLTSSSMLEIQQRLEKNGLCNCRVSIPPDSVNVFTD